MQNKTQNLSSRKRTWREFKVGDLVQVRTSRRCFDHIHIPVDQLPVAVILDVFSSNVYEPASADVMVGTTKMHVEQRRLILVSGD